MGEPAEKLEGILNKIKETLGPRNIDDELELRTRIQAINEHEITELMINRRIINAD